MTNVINQVAYLRTSREYPEGSKELVLELSKTYIDVASAVNTRTIGLYPTTRPAINGDSWYLSGNVKQQGLRQVYQFTVAGNIAHGISNLIPSQIVDLYGSWTDGTNAYGLIFGTNTSISGQVSAYVTPTNIVVVMDAGAPSIVSGTIVLSWISRP